MRAAGALCRWEGRAGQPSLGAGRRGTSRAEPVRRARACMPLAVCRPGTALPEEGCILPGCAVVSASSCRAAPAPRQPAPVPGPNPAPILCIQPPPPPPPPQMGLRLVTPDGRRITRLSRWVLRCTACFLVTKEMGRLFCPRCGNATLDKVQVCVCAWVGGWWWGGGSAAAAPFCRHPRHGVRSPRPSVLVLACQPCTSTPQTA